MSRVMDALNDEHRNMARLLTFLERQIDIISHAEEPDYDLVMDVLEYTRDYPDAYHHPKEDLVYDKLKTRDPAAAKTVGDLRHEHEKVAELSRHFAEVIENVLAESAVSRDRVIEIARAFVDAMIKHMNMEDTKFFPAALRSLTPEDWAEIDAAFDQRDDPLFGLHVAKAFTTLNEEIQRDAANPA